MSRAGRGGALLGRAEAGRLVTADDDKRAVSPTTTGTPLLCWIHSQGVSPKQGRGTSQSGSTGGLLVQRPRLGDLEPWSLSTCYLPCLST